ncbi:MAG: hypothetical protein IH884_05845 [Myxococcales bacterium]|nr:hypothetical protein [Myxococcales bacterium]
MVNRGLRFDAKLCAWLGVLACVAGGTVAGAQGKPAVETPAEAKALAGPADAYDREVPRSAMRGFLEACREGDYERAAEYLDLRRLDAKKREGRAVLARQLKFVLDQELWVELERLSQHPEGHSGDGLPPYRDRVGTLHTEEGPVDILLQRVPRSDGVSIWKISSDTVARIPALYDEFGYGPLDAWLPMWMLEANLFEIAFWQWLAVMALVVLAFLISWVAANGVLALGRPLVARSQTDFDDRLLAAVIGPLRLVIGILAFQLGTLPLGLAVPARRVFTGMATAIAFLALTWLAFRVIDIFANVFEKRFEEYPIRVDMLSRFCTPKQARATLEGLATGQVDVVIATHRILQKNVRFRDLGLLVVGGLWLIVDSITGMRGNRIRIY